MVIDYKKKYLKYKNKYIQFKGGACPEEEETDEEAAGRRRRERAAQQVEEMVEWIETDEEDDDEENDEEEMEEEVEEEEEEDEPIKLSDIPYDKDHTPKLKYIIAKIKTIIEAINSVIPSYRQRSSNETVELFLYWILHYKEVMPDHNFFDIIESNSDEDDQMPWYNYPINENDLFNKWLLEYIRKNEQMKEKIRTHASSVEDLSLCAIVDVWDQINIKAQKLWWKHAGFFLLHEEGSEEVQALDESDDDEENEEEDDEENEEEDEEEMEEEMEEEEMELPPTRIYNVDIPYHRIHTKTLDGVIKKIKRIWWIDVLQAFTNEEKMIYKFLQWLLYLRINEEEIMFDRYEETLEKFKRLRYEYDYDYIVSSGFIAWLEKKMPKNNEIIIEIKNDIKYEILFNKVDTFLSEDPSRSLFYYWFSIYRYTENYRPLSNRLEAFDDYLKTIKEAFLHSNDEQESKLEEWIKEHSDFARDIMNMYEEDDDVEVFEGWEKYAIAWLNDNDSCN